MKMLFELAREDNPPLFDELARFAKGTKRLNRLRTLAHEGLIRQQQLITSRSGPVADPPPSREPAGTSQESTISAAASEMFAGEALE